MKLFFNLLVIALLGSFLVFLLSQEKEEKTKEIKEIKIENNKLSFVQIFGSSNPEYAESWIKKMMPYAERIGVEQVSNVVENYLCDIKEACSENNVPLTVAKGIFLIENSRGIDKISPAGAAGIGQLMPVTARGFGLRVDSHCDERLNPKKAIPASVKYMRFLYDKYGRWDLVLLGYEQGETRVNRFIRSYIGLKTRVTPDLVKEKGINYLELHRKEEVSSYPFKVAAIFQAAS